MKQSGENNKLGAFDEHHAGKEILLDVQRQPGAKIVAAVDQIKDALPAPSGCRRAVDITERTDRTDTIRASVNDVEFELRWRSRWWCS